MKIKSLFNSPPKIYLAWIALVILFDLISIPVAISKSESSSGIPFVMLMYSFLFGICGILIISLITPFFFKKWFQKYWYVNVLIFAISSYIIVYYLFKIAVA